MPFSLPTPGRWFKDTWLSRRSLLEWLADGQEPLSRRSPARRRRRLGLEPLEPRWLPSYFTVTPFQQQVLVNGTATLTINAFPGGSDGGTGVSTYDVSWGDSNSNVDGGGVDLPNNYTFTHTYTTTGVRYLYIAVYFDTPSGPVDVNWYAIINVTGDPKASPLTSSCNCGCINSSGNIVQTAAAAKGPSVARDTAFPVRYADGVVTIAETDVRSTGFGFPWGQTRSWTNGPGYAVGGVNGSGWVDTQTPRLLQADGSTDATLFVANNGNTAEYFDLVDGVYQPRFDDPSQLTYDSGSDLYTLTDSAGDQLTFTGFESSTAAQQGEFASYTDAAGETMAVTSYTSDGHIAEMQRSTTSGSDTITESYLYSYLPTTDVNTGMLSSVTLRRKVNAGAWSTVQQAQYTYYDGTQTYGGSVGDLLTATTLDGSANVLSTSYYRYNSANGLAYVFNGASSARLTAALGTDLGDLTDTEVAPYADNYFQYDSEQRVTEEVVQGGGSSTDTGGLGTYTFSYTASSNAAGVNSWATKTVVTNPDSSTDTVYTNAYGAVMLDDHYDPSSGVDNDTFYEYNAAGQLILEAQPSAVTGYDDSYADLLHNVDGSYAYLSSDSGLLTTDDYYTATTATATTAGGVAGYQQDTQIQQGQDGTSIPQESWQYFSKTAGSVTVNPVATDIVYRNDDGTGAESTTFSYTWFSGTAQMQSQTESAPVVTSGQNGPGTADVTTTYFDENGNPIWVKDPDGYLQYAAYDPATGAQVTQIADVNTSDTATFTNLPSGWTTPTGGGLQLVTTDQVDALGRTTKETSPGGTITYTVYLDAEQEVRVYPGWDGSTSTTTGPTQVIRQDAADGYTEALTMSATPSLTDGVPNGSEAISGLQALTRDYTNAAGQLTAQDAYFALSGLTYSTGVLGTESVNYYEMLYDYDAGGRLDRTETPTGTIYRTVYDSYGDKLSDWVGTNDTPSSGDWSPTNNDGTSNLVEVSSYQYDNGGVGNGNLTEEVDYPHDGMANRVTQYYYDWRDRLVAEKAGVESSETDGVHRPIIYTTYDNLDEAVETQEYDGDGVTISTVDGVPQAPDASLLRAQEIDSYDNQGRVYQTQVFDVNPSSGAVSSTALTTNDYYDHRGDQIAESDPGGLWTKDVVDGADRLLTEYTTDGAGGASWADATSVADDHVLEQVQTSYDADSNVIETVDSQRFDDATGTGALGTPTSGVAARVYYSATYYDLADRPVADVNVGTNGGSSWTRPDDVPTGSDSVLVTSYSYNAAGEVQDVTDPLGIDTRTYYDALGRTTETIAHYTGSAETANADVATQYGYDGDNHLLFLIADEPADGYQETEYVYGVTTASGSAVNSNDLLAAVEHPDPTTGAPSSSQKDTYTVNALGDVTSMTDRNGNTHQDTYDVLGRPTSDAVTTLGSGVDGSIRRLNYAYDSQGNQYLNTSYDAATGGSIVNQVENVYNGLDQLTGQYQSVSGAVTIGTTPEVQYAYTEMADGVNNSRPVSMTYPSGFALDYNYGSSGSLNDSISRLDSLSNSTITLESYKYLGLDTVVERDHPQNGVNLSYLSQDDATGDAGDKYVGLDRFGRVVDQNWYNTETSASVDDTQYGYNADGDVLYQANTVNAAFSELFTYDGLHQLTSFQRGTLNSTKTSLTGAGSDSQAWTLDALGNATSITTNGTTQARTANQQNQYTAVGSATTTYDANGDLTKDENGQQYVYDAWNRLVAVKNASDMTIASYSYDGLGRRITQTDGATTTDLYYSAAGQVLEEDVGGEVQAQNVWSPVYVNALVLRDQSSADNGVLDQRLYVVQDVNWNVTALVNTSGSVVERYVDEPYGTVTVLAPDWSVRGSSAYAMPYLWQGERYDATAGLYHTMTRDVSPTLERPLQPDPSGLAPDNNDYRWERDNPAMAVDPSGLWEWNLGTRALGVLRGIGGVVEVGIGLAAAAVPNPAYELIGGILIIHGGDNIGTGFLQAITGEEQQMRTSALFEELGKQSRLMDPKTARQFGDNSDTAISLLALGSEFGLLRNSDVWGPNIRMQLQSEKLLAPKVIPQPRQVCLAENESAIGIVKNGQVVKFSAPNTSHEFLAKQAGVYRGPKQLEPGVQAFSVIKGPNGELVILPSINFPGLSNETIAVVKNFFR